MFSYGSPTNLYHALEQSNWNMNSFIDLLLDRAYPFRKE